LDNLPDQQHTIPHSEGLAAPAQPVNDAQDRGAAYKTLLSTSAVDSVLASSDDLTID
jgi:hypothetical protein